MYGQTTLFIAAALAVSVSQSAAELLILHAPSYVRFVNVSSQQQLSGQQVSDIILETFGLHGDTTFNWTGLLQGNFFSRPKASVLISVSGLPDNANLNLPAQFAYPTSDQADEVDSGYVVPRLESYAEQDQSVLFVDMYFDADKRQAEVTSYEPKLRVTPRCNKHELLVSCEIRTVQHIMTRLHKHPKLLRENSPDFYHFRFDGLTQILRSHGAESPHVTQAVIDLRGVVNELTRDFRDLYHDNVVVAVLTSKKSGTREEGRTGRTLLQATTAPDVNQLSLNIAPEFTWMYPEMWNIAMWFMIVWILIVYGVAWCMWFTDPGSDGVIYRMTTHHIKNE